MEPVEDLEEEEEEELEEGSEVEYEEDPEEDSSEQPQERSDAELEEDSEVEYEEDPEENPSEGYLSEPYSEHGPGEAVKQEVESGGNAAGLHGSSQKPEAVVGDESGSVKQDNPGPRKRRRSRWDQDLVEDRETGTGNRKGRKRKTRWDADDSRKKHLVIDPEFHRLSEINRILEQSQIDDDRPEAERSPSPEPVYNNLGIRINTREVRLRDKLIEERVRIISKLAKNNPKLKTYAYNNLKYNNGRFFKKLYVPVEEYPTCNFIGLILGPKGNTQKRMENETGATIRLRGKGAVKTSQKGDQSDAEKLHVFIEASNRTSLKAAASMVKKLLIPTEEMSDHKRAQLLELEKLRKENLMSSCSVCKDPGHNDLACPHKRSTLKSPCDTCGDFSHPTSGCQRKAPPSTSRLGIASAPNTTGKSFKEIDPANLYVGYLPRTVDDSRLRELFSPFGTIIQFKVARDHTTSISKGHGFVKFATPDAAAMAIRHMNGRQVENRRLAVRVAGTPPTTGSSPVNLLPAYPGPLAAIPKAPLRQDLPQYMLPEAQVSFQSSGGIGFPQPSSVYLDSRSQFPQTGARVIPPVYSSRTIASNSKTAFSNSGSVAMFPGDPNYSGGSVTKFPGDPNYASGSKFPGDPDYAGGSEFQSYFSF